MVVTSPFTSPIRFQGPQFKLHENIAGCTTGPKLQEVARACVNVILSSLQDPHSTKSARRTSEVWEEPWTVFLLACAGAMFALGSGWIA